MRGVGEWGSGLISLGGVVEGGGCRAEEREKRDIGMGAK